MSASTEPGSRTPAIAVIGVGNPLMADEGVGIAAIEALEERGMPEGVELIDAGSAGMTLLHIIKDYDAVLIIDAANFGGEPGEVRAFGPDEVRSVKALRRESLHEADLMQVLELSRTLGEIPETVVLFAVQFQKVEMGSGMTEPVRSAVPVVVKLVADKVEELLTGY
jgi:hydrogenase maturation protease